MTSDPPADVRAAGVVVFAPGRRVLLVHRPKYDDWSFPKGKLDAGEHAVAAAVREVAEETGLHVRLGVPLAPQHYLVDGPRQRRLTKTVSYWVGRCVGDDDVSGYLPNAEIDAVRWVPVDDAAALLSYGRDRTTLADARSARRRTRALVVLRHGQARSRRAWHGDDRQRPLLRTGEHQADRLVPLLAAYDVSRLLTSSSLRCRQTLEPYAMVTGWAVEPTDVLSEEDATPKRVRRLVQEAGDDVAAHDRTTVLCTHRPVLPAVFDALGVEVGPALEPGEVLVAHLRKGAVVAVERHLAP